MHWREWESANLSLCMLRYYHYILCKLYAPSLHMLLVLMSYYLLFSYCLTGLLCPSACLTVLQSLSYCHNYSPRLYCPILTSYCISVLLSCCLTVLLSYELTYCPAVLLSAILLFCCLTVRLTVSLAILQCCLTSHSTVLLSYCPTVLWAIILSCCLTTVLLSY